ncbi:hypothetical protein B9Z55_004733 [Caenorhabditis nigoni]|uniref:Protein kinase domain-containing protein n=1 Tax=Caenorhabditis nigoni TaxID=1611254 RepID=A0A2G5UYK6_9PELO|nr:hypothetical protein B9Z55_004733 [Caenorhabditis nigoni]
MEMVVRAYLESSSKYAKREIENLRGVGRHQNIIQSAWSEFQGKRYYVVLELFDANLFDFIRTEDLQNKIKIKVEAVLDGVSQGLAALHHRRIALTNLKPTNILLSRAKFINRHPYFWSDDLKLDYIEAVSEKFKTLKLPNDPECILIEMDSIDVIGRSFKTKMCSVIASEVSTYNAWEVYEVLRLMRNFKAHYYEASIAVSQVFYPEPIKILEYFEGRFPKLLTYVFKATQHLGHTPGFGKFFPGEISLHTLANRPPSGRRPPSKNHPLGVFRSSGQAILCCPRAVRDKLFRLHPDEGSPRKNQDQSGRSSGWGVTKLGTAALLPNHTQQDWDEYKKTAKSWDVEVANKESFHFLAEHLIARSTDPHVPKIPARFINRYPYFWSDDLKLDYIQAVSEKFKKLNFFKDPEHLLLQMDEQHVIRADFKAKLCKFMTLEFASYKTGQVYEVLRLMRNFNAHYYETSTAVSKVFSSEPIKIFEYFEGRFPKLLTHVFKATQHLGHTPGFGKFYPGEISLHTSKLNIMPEME